MVKYLSGLILGSDNDGVLVEVSFFARMATEGATFQTRTVGVKHSKGSVTKKKRENLGKIPN